MSALINITNSFVLGALHALEPGHGKTFIGTYIMRGKTNKNQLFSLGIGMLFSHVFILLFLGFAIYYFFPKSDLNRVESLMKLIAPIIMIIIGIYMVIKFKAGNENCSCVYHSKQKTLKKQKPNFKDLTIATTKNNVSLQHSKKSMVSVGIVSSIVPCPSALAVFISSIGTGKITNSIISLLIYSLGFAAVMLGIAFSFSIFGNRLNGIKNNKFIANLNYYSAFLIIGIGITYLTINLV